MTIAQQSVSISRWTPKTSKRGGRSRVPFFCSGARPAASADTAGPGQPKYGRRTPRTSSMRKPCLPAIIYPTKRRPKPPLPCASFSPRSCSPGRGAPRYVGSDRRRRRHVEEAAHGVPKQVTIDGDGDRMRGVREDHQLFVTMRELLIEVEQIFHGGDAVVLAPHQ